jgi:hypothetical protein
MTIKAEGPRMSDEGVLYLPLVNYALKIYKQLRTKGRKNKSYLVGGGCSTDKWIVCEWIDGL